MRAPDFWWQPKPNRLARLLAPAGLAYGAITSRRMAQKGASASVPVLCVGNFVAGGAGKTPTAIAIARALQAKGERPAFLSRGYGGKIPTPCKVDVMRHAPKDVGDEALLLAHIAPTVIGADRAASAKYAEVLGATVVILDDGLQNPTLRHDLRLAVIDGASGIGNGLCVPAGPLRAPFVGQLAQTTAVLFVGKGDGTAALAETIRGAGKPVLGARLAADKTLASGLAGRKVVAFAGIGLPRKFRATLEDLGAEIAGWHSFPDHHVYTPRALKRLQVEANRKKARLVTTEKDFIRFAPILPQLKIKLPMPIALPVELKFDDEAAIGALLQAALDAARERIAKRT